MFVVQQNQCEVQLIVSFAPLKLVLIYHKLYVDIVHVQHSLFSTLCLGVW